MEEMNNKDENTKVSFLSGSYLNKIILIGFSIVIAILIGVFVYVIIYDVNNSNDNNEVINEPKEEIITKKVDNINDIDTIYNYINNIDYNEEFDYDYKIVDNKLYYKNINNELTLVELTKDLEIKKIVITSSKLSESLYVLTINNELYSIDNFSLENNNIKLVRLFKDKKIDNITSKKIVYDESLESYSRLIYQFENKNYLYIDETNSKEWTEYVKSYNYLELYTNNMTFGYTINSNKELVRKDKVVYMDSNNNKIITKYIINDSIDNKIYIIDSNNIYESDSNYNINVIGSYTNLNKNEDSLELKVNKITYIFNIKSK